MSERLPLPRYVDWPIFPFEVVDGDLAVKELIDRLDAELPRAGEGDRPCDACVREDGDFVWVDDRWRLSALPERPTPLDVVLILETRAHADLGDLDELHAGELGRLTVAVERAMLETLTDVGRVHVYRWSDGAAHFHQWFMPRPAGAWQFSGWSLPLWEQLLPARPATEVAAAARAVAAQLADTYGGRAIA